MPAATAEKTTTLPVGTWTADPVHSEIGFAIRHNGVGRFRGRFADYDAQLVVDDAGARLVGTARVESVDVGDENLAAHLASPDFFDAERHPEIRFDASSARRDGDQLIADGQLTIKGVTKTVEARGTVTDPVVGIGGDERIGLELEATVDRNKYGLGWNAPLPGGGLVLGDDVTLVVALELAKEA